MRKRNRKKFLCYQLSPTFQYLNYNIYALVIIWAKEIKVWKNLRMHVTIGQTSAEIVPPSCLFVTVVHQPGSSSPPFQSMCSVDIICMCEASSAVPLVPWHGPSLPSCRHTSLPWVLSPVSHWSSQGRPSHSCMEYTPRGSVSLSLVNVEQIVHPDWETAFDLKLPATHAHDSLAALSLSLTLFLF